MLGKDTKTTSGHPVEVHMLQATWGARLPNLKLQNYLCLTVKQATSSILRSAPGRRDTYHPIIITLFVDKLYFGFFKFLILTLRFLCSECSIFEHTHEKFQNI